MVSICTRLLARGLRPSLIAPCRTFADKMYPDPLDLATGLEKRELLAHLSGNTDPFQMNIQKRGLGSRDSPTVVPSSFDSRIVGCICEEDSTTVNWMWLHRGTPKRCECGHWYKLGEAKTI